MFFIVVGLSLKFLSLRLINVQWLNNKIIIACFNSSVCSDCFNQSSVCRILIQNLIALERLTSSRT